MRRLFFDIETSPLVVLSWRTGYKINLSHENILSERKIICAAWKWEGESTVHSARWDGDQSDRPLIEKVVPVLEKADEIVGHWLDGFDMPWVRTRALVHRVQTLPKYKTIDTCKWARRHFYFCSNKLDYLARFLGIGAKIRTEYDLWRKVVLHKDARALSYMVEYCKVDVELLEKVWARLQQAVPHQTHAGVMNGAEKWTCPKNGSENVSVSKTKVTALGTKQFQMNCRDCGCYYTISQKSHNDYREEKMREKERAK